jgi:hypothetical protein
MKKWKQVNKWDLVEIKWRDAIRQQGGWLPETEFDYTKGDRFANSMMAVGYVTKITDDHMYLTQQISLEDKAISHVLSVPRKSIIKTKILKKMK